jgi:hypothetical protein
MRALNYMIAIVALLTGSSMAGSAESDLPGIGTFSYNGSSIATQAPALVAAAEVGH